MTTASLHILKEKAYSAYKDKLEETEQSLIFEDWENTMEKKSSHFLFWGLVLHLEFTCLRYIDEQYFREFILGAKPPCASPHFLALQTGDGSI